MENLNKYLSSKIEPIHKSFISTKKVEQKENANTQAGPQPVQPVQPQINPVQPK